MSEEPSDGSRPRRPVRQRPAPAKVAEIRARREREAEEAAATKAGRDRGGRRPVRTQGRAPVLPRAWWLGAAVFVTLAVILLVDVVSGWGDPPASCSRSICTLGQGVGLLSLAGAVVLGALLVVSFLVLAVGAAQRQPAQPRAPREPRRPRTR